MDTTITISSKRVTNKADFLHLTYNSGKNKDAIISVDSSNFGESGSVSWDKKSLSNIEKVTNWMNQSDKEYVRGEFTELVKNNEAESKSLILVRCDFNKTSNSQSYSQSPYNRTTSLIDFFKDENVAVSNNKLPMSPNVDNSPKKSERSLTNHIYLEKDGFYSPVSKTNGLSFASEHKSGITDDICLSPESRKKELCHYLQLMNPADKKDILILQNRRSSRVKNLVEQKQVQEQLKEINVVDKDDDSQKLSTLKSFKELKIRLKRKFLFQDIKEDNSFVFPFPPRKLMTTVDDFDDIMVKLITKLKKKCRAKNITFYTQVKYKKDKSKEIKNSPKRGLRKNERMRFLRSNGKFKNISMNKLLAKKQKELDKLKLHDRPKSRKSVTAPSVKSRAKSVRSPSPNYFCEMVSLTNSHHDTEDRNVDIDLEHFIDDINDYEGLSEEHKKCLIESRMLSNSPVLVSNKDSHRHFMPPLYGFSKSDTHEISEMCEKYKNTIHINSQLHPKEAKIKTPHSEKKEQQSMGGNTYLIVNIHNPDSSEHPASSTDLSEHSSSESSLQEHDYAGFPSKKTDKGDDDDENINSVNYVDINSKSISKNSKYELLPFKSNEGTKSLHKSLQLNPKKIFSLSDNSSLVQEWDTHNSPKQHLKKQKHFININSENGAVIRAFYVGYNLVLCQEFVISIWMQTALGNVLGSQNMWIPRGQTQRLVLNNRCQQKDSVEKVMCLEGSVVYIELWMKEHKSEMRQGPVADVFVALYYWKQRQTGLDKKVLQLENINGFADDVQYCVMKNFPKIIVSWHSATEDSTHMKQTFIHAYQLASDYQTVSNVYNLEPVGHYVSSLHNIEDYDDLVMGCGENKITLWSIEFGHIIATIELNDIKSPLSTLWVKCDRGFLFALQQCVDRELRLIAINGINHTWKKLASYLPPDGFDRLRGVCIENGLLLSFYDQGILCWNAETGEPVEEINVENDLIPSGTYVILVEDDQVIVKHALTHLMAMSVEES